MVWEVYVSSFIGVYLLCLLIAYLYGRRVEKKSKKVKE